MALLHERYGRRYVARAERVTVIDIGGPSGDVDSHQSIFVDPAAEGRITFLGVELAAGPGIDVVLEDPYVYPFATDSIDIVICSQVLEHAEFFWRSVQEMVRVVKPGGLIFLIAPAGGPIHRHPFDCYRFYPDSYKGLAKYTGSRLLNCWRDHRGPWYDLAGVFTKGEDSAFDWGELGDAASARLYAQAMADQEAGNTEAALRVYRQLEYGPLALDTDYLCRYMAAAIRHRDDWTAYRISKKCLDLLGYCDNEKLLETHGHCCLRLGRRGEAKKAFQLIENMGAEESRLRGFMGMLDLAESNGDRARAKQKAIEAAEFVIEQAQSAADDAEPMLQRLRRLLMTFGEEALVERLDAALPSKG
jgi:hypothetical protein